MVVQYHDIEMVMENSSSVFYYEGQKTTIIDVIENLTKEAAKHEWEVFVNFLGLSECYLSVLTVLSKMGYQIPMRTDKKRDMRKDDVRYRVTQGNCFYIQIKVGEKRFLTLQTVETVIALKKLPETEEQALKDMALYHYTRESFLAGLKRSENRILYSSSAISRTSFNRANPQYSRSAQYLRRQIKIDGKWVRKSTYLEKELRPCIHSGLCFVSTMGYFYDGPGIVLDVNSLYDYVAVTAPLPDPILLKVTDGTPEEADADRQCTYSIWKCEVSATLKEDGVPCIIADGESSIFGTEYLKTMNKRYLTLTQADRDMLYENYRITYFRIWKTYIFPVDTGTFKKYIDPLYEKKRMLSKGPERDFVKNQLVGFLGTFAKRIHHDTYDLYVAEDGEVKQERRFLTSEEYNKKLDMSQGLLFVNAAIVSAARKYILSFIRKHQDRFLYTDTDSLHLAGTDIPDDIPISDKLGDFKVEHTFTKCYYRGVKSYAIVEDGKVVTTIAGVPKNFQDYLNKSDDENYLKSVIDNQRLKEIYIADIPIRTIDEDVSIQECEYTYSCIQLTKSHDEWNDFIQGDKTEEAMKMYNRIYSDKSHPHTFKEALSALKHIKDCI